MFLDQTLYEPGMPGLTIAWKRKEGIGKETGLVSGETVANGTLTVSQNHLEHIESGMVTYYLYITYTDPVMNTVTDVMADITFTEILNGVQGESSVVMSLVAPEGTVFLNGTGSLRLQASVYKGADDIAGQASFIWKAFSGGNWKTIEGAAGDTLMVNGTDVPGMCTFRCEMTFEGKTYLDTIT